MERKQALGIHAIFCAYRGYSEEKPVHSREIRGEIYI